MQSKYVNQRSYDALKAELTSILLSAPSPKQQSALPEKRLQAFAKTQPEAVKPSIYSASNDDPASIAALKRQAKLLHQRQDTLRIALHDADTDEDRHEIARELIEVVLPGLDTIYSQIRAFAKTGIEPENPDLEPFRMEVAKEVFEYVYLERFAKKGTLTDDQRERHSIYRQRYKSTWKSIQPQP